jgi:uncharacterized glyoxalase superfamily protein PhnB
MRKNRSVPACVVIPELDYPDVEAAAAWLVKAFGFRVRISMGAHRAQMHAGYGAIVLTKREEREPTCPCSILLRVESVDEFFERALKAGCTVTRAPKDYPYGERQCNVVDFAGHRWTFTESIADVGPEEWGGVAAELE